MDNPNYYEFGTMDSQSDIEDTEYTRLQAESTHLERELAMLEIGRTKPALQCSSTQTENEFFEMKAVKKELDLKSMHPADVSLPRERFVTFRKKDPVSSTPNPVPKMEKHRGKPSLHKVVYQQD